jgi:hypothetical protein
VILDPCHANRCGAESTISWKGIIVLQILHLTPSNRFDLSGMGFLSRSTALIELLKSKSVMRLMTIEPLIY